MNSKSSTLIPSAPSLFEATLSVMNELIAVLNEEVRLLNAQKIAGIQELLRHKTKLNLTWQANMKVFAAQPDLLRALKPEQRAKLKDTGTKLAEVVHQNASVLKAASEATQKLIHNIVNAVRQEKLPPLGYTDPRLTKHSMGAYSPTCRSVAVSRKV